MTTRGRALCVAYSALGGLVVLAWNAPLAIAFALWNRRTIDPGNPG